MNSNSIMLFHVVNNVRTKDMALCKWNMTMLFYEISQVGLQKNVYFFLQLLLNIPYKGNFHTCWVTY